MNNLHFCGGLPRAGSTVLMNVLQQHPEIFTTGTCALYELLKDKILIKGRYSESFQAMSIDQADRAMYGLIHGATKGWFEALTTKPVVISKRHGWSNLLHLFPNSKFICMVRDLRDVVESFEKVNHKTLSLHTYGDSQTFVPSMHVHEKYKHYFTEANALSINLTTEVPRMMELFKKQPSKVMFMRYEDFTKDPLYMINKLYNFLQVRQVLPELNKIEQSQLFEHDHAYFRERTDHITSSTFKYYEPPVRKLPAEFHNRVIKENTWFYEAFYPEVLKEV